MTYGYLEMLGTLSKHKEGIVCVFTLCLNHDNSQGFPRLMEEAKLFTAFYHLSELRSREDLIKGIIENIDYSMFVFLHSCNKLLMNLSDGHPRIVLSKALTSSYKVSCVR